MANLAARMQSCCNSKKLAGGGCLFANVLKASTSSTEGGGTLNRAVDDDDDDEDPEERRLRLLNFDDDVDAVQAFAMGHPMRATNEEDAANFILQSKGLMENKNGNNCNVTCH
jgi:hypothetical protein